MGPQLYDDRALEMVVYTVLPQPAACNLLLGRSAPRSKMLSAADVRCSLHAVKCADFSRILYM